MNCNNVKSLLDEYLDNDLTLPERAEVDAHLVTCGSCQSEFKTGQRLLRNLQALPVPSIRSGFQRQAFTQARRAHDNNRSGFVLGFSSAVAAGILIWLGLAWWQIQLPSAVVQMPGVVLQVEQPNDVRLVFNANEDLQPVDFTLLLPPGVLLQGHPSQQEIRWQDRLVKGRNVLNLVLIASRKVEGEVVAVISHHGQKRRFLVPLKSELNRSGARLPLTKAINFS
ncbi:MAG: zf-HC2 domain-containing protein [Candidatus Thiodiazotropha sp.]